MALQHIVMFRLHDDVDEATRDEAVRCLRILGEEEQVRQWRVELSTDTRKGTIIVEIAEFADAASFQEFRMSEAHQRTGDFMRQIADWWVADFDL